MEWWQAFLLAVVEGITEFLPVSSTGHMILFSRLVGLQSNSFVTSYQVIIQFGAILSIVIMYLKRWREVLSMYKEIGLALIPTGVVGLFFYPFIKNVLMASQLVVVVSLLLGGLFMILVERFLVNSKARHVRVIDHFLIGIGQSMAVIPGVSRSMATIMTARLLGMSREKSVEFSFLLAVPTMIMASGKEIFETSTQIESGGWGMIGFGLVVSFLVAWLVNNWFISYVKRNSFSVFGWYRIVLALVYIIFVL